LAKFVFVVFVVNESDRGCGIEAFVLRDIVKFLALKLIIARVRGLVRHVKIPGHSNMVRLYKYTTLNAAFGFWRSLVDGRGLRFGVEVNDVHYMCMLAPRW
jgi:hypothetical protein